MAMHWRTLLHGALMVLASIGLAGPVPLAPAQPHGASAPHSAGEPESSGQSQALSAALAGHAAAPAATLATGTADESGTTFLTPQTGGPPVVLMAQSGDGPPVIVDANVSLAAALEPAPDAINAPGTLPPQMLPPGTFEELVPPGQPAPPVVPLNDPAQVIGDLPAIMVPNSPFLPLATQPEPVNWLPVLSEPWSQRPLAAGMFTGILWGDVSMGENVTLDSGLIFGGRFGWDFDERWAWEGRVGFASLNVEYPGTVRPSTVADAILWDLQLQVAIFTRPRLKTYFAFGAGMGFFDLVDPYEVAITETVITVPIGLGLKYRYDDWIALRLDFADNLSLGNHSSGLSNVHNLSLVGGLEIRFGGYQRDYWPWNLR